MNEQERAELEYYRQQYGQTAPDSQPEPLQAYGSPFGPPAAQDALSVEEQAAFWPEELDYAPKYQIAERHRRSYGSWPKQGDS